MKKLAAFSILLMAACHSQPKPTKLSDLDLANLKKTEAQFQALQMRYQSEATPIIQEHDAIYTKWCVAAGLVYGGQSGNCRIDTGTGAVSKVGALPQKK